MCPVAMRPDPSVAAPASTRAGRRCVLLLSLALLLAVLTPPALALEPFDLEYSASYMGLQAEGRMVLTREGEGRWRYRLDIRNAIATLEQITEFEDRNGQWRPLSGSDTSLLLVKRNRKTAIYDWERGVATWSGDVKPERAGPVKLQPGDLDALLVNLAVARDLAAGRPLRYRMVDDGRVRELHYTVAGREPLSIGGKVRQATRVVRTDGEKQTIAWVVDGLPVPARILQRRNGKDEIDLRVKTLR